MIVRRLGDEEADKIRKKQLMSDYHFTMRWLYRLDFKKARDVVENGEIWQEGKNKFRAVMPIKNGKIAFVIFYEFEDYLELKTAGVTSRTKMKWG